MQKTLLIFFLGTVWGVFFVQMQFEWRTHPQYQYGYFVPALAVYLAFLRIPTIPPPKPSTNRTLLITALFVMLLTMAPLRIFQEANPEWRALAWLHGFLAACSTCAALALAFGGGVTLHFLFPIAFLFTSIPWPSFIETPVTHGLMNASAAAALDWLNWQGIPAWRRGHLIEVSQGIVGVNEACSGIRSLQSGIMASLFWGEVQRLSAGRRSVLLGLAIVATLFLNFVRTSFLAWIAATRSPSAIEPFHDSAGLTIAFLLFALLWFVALRMRRREVSGANKAPSAPANFAIQWPSGLMAAGLALCLGAEIAVAAWYGSTEPAHRGQAWLAFQASLPGATTNRSFEPTSISREIQAELRADTAQCYAWKNLSGTEGRIFLFEWKPGRVSALAASIHRPDICLPSAGFRLLEDRGLMRLQAGGFDLPARAYLFESRAGRVHVFHAWWKGEADLRDPLADQAPDWRERVRSVLQRRRAGAQQVIQIALSGCATFEAAASLAHQILSQAIVLQIGR